MMGSIYDEIELTKLEQEENDLTEEALIALLLQLKSTQSDIEKELRSFYQKYGTDGVVTYAEARKWLSEKNHQKRLTWLMILFSAAFSDLYGRMNPTFGKMINKVIEKEFGFFGVALDEPNIKWGADNLAWFDRLADDINTWQAHLVGDIKRSMLMKKNIEDVIKTMDKRFLTMQTVTKRLAVTETTAVGSIARKAAFKELGITKYQYFAREDERTCEQCGALHGLVFPISAYEVGVTASPIHTSCRCWEMPIQD